MTADERRSLVAATLRYVAEWVAETERPMLYDAADDTEHGPGDWDTCPVCQEMTCDDSCPLAPIRPTT